MKDGDKRFLLERCVNYCKEYDLQKGTNHGFAGFAIAEFACQTTGVPLPSDLVAPTKASDIESIYTRIKDAIDGW